MPRRGLCREAPVQPGHQGKRLCRPRALRQLDGQHEISVVDTLRYGTNRFSEGDLSRIRMVQTDVTDAAALARTIGEFGPDAVIHLAAIHDIPGCETDPALAVRTDVAGTVNALMACREAGAAAGVDARAGAAFTDGAVLSVSGIGRAASVSGAAGACELGSLTVPSVAAATAACRS
jgi:FlaA1/EpsC-like NDP-sugar epimerase